jgi:hypothetical protein
MDQQSIQEMSEQEVFGRVLWDAISNTFWFGIGAVVIALIGIASRKIATGLFIVYAIIIVLDAIWNLVLLLLHFVSIPLAIFSGRKAIGKEVWVFASTLVRVIEVAVGLALGWYLYRRLF